MTANSLLHAGFRQAQLSLSHRILPPHAGQRRRWRIEANGQADPFLAEPPCAAGRLGRRASCSRAKDNRGPDGTQRKIGNKRRCLHSRTQLRRGPRGRGEEHQVIRDSNQRKFNRQKSVNYRGRRRMVRSGITVKVVQCVVAVTSFGS